VTPDRLQERMQRALEVAEQGRGLVEPNPMVGCVVLNEAGAEVGIGSHLAFGRPHAEVVALDRAGKAAVGGTLIVTLEPCSHFGKTPPCVDRIISAGIKRVVAAMLDPFPEVAGKGIAKLRAAGIDVEVGVLEEEARALNAPYVCLVERNRPYFRAKWAMTADGRTAAVDGSSKWITGDEARFHANIRRGLMDAIVVGAGTVLADDPNLTARVKFARKAVRVVIESRACTPPQANVVATAREWPTMIVVGEDASVEATKPFEDAGCEVMRSPITSAGRVSLLALAMEMGRRRWTNVLVEGGAELLGSFLVEGLIDAVELYLAPKILGGRSALSPVGGIGLPTIASALQLDAGDAVRLGDDYYIPMWVRR
jgi:diaminohydroxyphosphoribosylaminopyrimidine deaminase / 5-amino-6-(5-phosphoribosylamino)uracil reductase